MTPCSRGRVVLTVSPTTTNQEVLAVSAILHTFLRAANIHILKITSTVYKPIWRLLHVAKCDRLIKTMASKPLRRVMLLMTPWGMIQMYLLPHYIHHIWGHSKAPHCSIISKLREQVLEWNSVRWLIAWTAYRKMHERKVRRRENIWEVCWKGRW